LSDNAVAMLGQVKAFLRDELGIPPWSVLLVVGLLAHLSLTALLRKPSSSPCGLLAPLTLGVAVEAYEIWVQYRDIGFFAEGNDPAWLIISRHGLDVLRMLALPALLVANGNVGSR
jgi:hypothetical protein